MSLIIALTDEEWTALDLVLAFTEGIIGVRPYQPREHMVEMLRLVRDRLDTAVEEQARGRVFLEHIHELSEREFQGGGPR